MTKNTSPKHGVGRFAHSDLKFRISSFGFIILLCFAGCHSSSPQTAGAATNKAEPAVHVTAGVPVRKAIRRVTVQPGQIQAFEQTALFVKLPGYVQKIHKDIGDRVEKTTPLADLWIPELQDEARQKAAMLTEASAGTQQAAAAVRAAEKSVESAQAGVHEAQAGTIRAQGKYERWKSEHARIVQLAASQSVDRKLVDETQNELSAAEAARGEAQAKVASAEAMLAERRLGVEKAIADRAVAEAKVVKATADLAGTNSLLQYTQVRMPYNGVVVERNVNLGDFVQPASSITARPLFVVAQSDVVRIFVDVPEMEAPLVVLGAKGIIHVQSLPNQKVEGTVTRTSWALGANRTLHTELDIPNPDRVLRPGMYATAEIVLQEHPDVIAIPLSSIVTVEKQPMCYCVENGRLVRKPITLGLQTAQEAEVASGLSGKDIVVQSPVATLRDGQAVQVEK